MLTLFHYPLCGPSRAIRLVLGEYGAAFDLVEVRPWALTRDFLSIDPAGSLPVLSFDGKTVCGVYPISEYLSESAPWDGPSGVRAPLWPGTAIERAEARRVADWFLRKFEGEVSQYLLEEKVYKPLSAARTPPDLASIRAGRANLRYHLSYVSFLAEQRNWLGGDHISFADFAAAGQISAMDYLSEIEWSAFPEAKAWYARIKSRPAFRLVLQDRLPGYNPPDYYANLDF